MQPDSLLCNIPLYRLSKCLLKIFVPSDWKPRIEAGIVTKEDVESLAKTQEEIKKQIALKKSKKLNTCPS